MTSLAVFSFIIFAAYVGTTTALFGVPSSLSDTFYLLGKRDGYGGIFTGAMLLMAMTIFAPMIEATRGDMQILAFACPAALAFVGAAPCFKEEESVIHTIAALVAAVSGIAWCLFLTPYWFIVPIVAFLLGEAAFVTRTASRCYIWWLEMVAFISVYACLLCATIG